MRREASAGLGRVAAKRDDVADAEIPIAARDVFDLAPARADAGQVRGGRERGFMDDALDRLVGALAGRTASPVGHGHEPGLQWREGLDRLPQGLGHPLVLRRKELEADRDVAVGFREQRRVLGKPLKRVHAALRCRTPLFEPRHKVTVSSPPLRCSTRSMLRPANANQAAIASSSKPRRMWASVLAQLLALVCREVDDQKSPAGRQHARRLGDRGCRRVRVVEHLVDDDAVGAAVGEREGVHVALAKARRNARRFQLHPCQAKHFRGAVDASRVACAPGEQLDHAAGAGADVDQPAEAPAAERPFDGPLDIALGDVERTNPVPHLSVGGEIAVRGLRAFCANPLGARSIGFEQGAGRPIRPGIEKREQWLRPLRPGKRHEHPASLLAAVEDARVAENLQVPGHPRLALAEDLCELSDGQLHDAQKRDDPKPGGIGKRLEAVGKRESIGHWR